MPGLTKALGTAKKGTVSDARSTREAIDKACDALIPLTKKPGRLFRSRGLNGGTWSEDTEKRTLGTENEDANVLGAAHYWFDLNLGVAVQMSARASSGDWTQVVDYCFRSDGSLARMESVLVTVDVFDSADETHNGVKRSRVRYFDPEGREIGRRVEIRNLVDGALAKRRFADVLEQVYRRSSSLPFYRLLRK